MFKRLLLVASASVFTLSIFSLLTLGTLSFLLRPNHLKKWATASGTYDKLPTIVINQAANSSEAEEDSGTSLTDGPVRKAAESALTPAFFKQSSEQIIDGSFGWLDGKTAQPDFKVDLLAVKQQFADNLGIYLKQRYEALPACPEGVLPNSTDPFQIDCRPSDELLDIDQIISDQKLALLEEESFLGSEQISPETLGGEEPGRQNVFAQSAIPASYKWFRLSPAIFGGLALLSGLLVILLCQSKKFGVRKLGWRLVIAGVLAVVATLLGMFGLIKLTDLLTSQPPDSMVTPYASVVKPLITAARADILIFSLVASLAVITIGVIILVATRSLSRKARSTSPQTPATAIQTPPVTPPAAPAAAEADRPAVPAQPSRETSGAADIVPSAPPVRPRPRTRPPKPPLIQ